MGNSSKRILTTHTGSLPRPSELMHLIDAREEGKLNDPAALEACVAAAVDEIVRKQVESGVDIVNDGEVSKPSYATYVTDRLTGFDGESRPPARVSPEAADFPDFYRTLLVSVGGIQRPVCTGPITWRGDALVQRDIDNLNAALHDVTAASPVEAFMTAAWLVSPKT